MRRGKTNSCLCLTRPYLHRCLCVNVCIVCGCVLFNAHVKACLCSLETGCVYADLGLERLPGRLAAGPCSLLQCYINFLGRLCSQFNTHSNTHNRSHGAASERGRAEVNVLFRVVFKPTAGSLWSELVRFHKYSSQNVSTESRVSTLAPLTRQRCLGAGERKSKQEVYYVVYYNKE